MLSKKGEELFSLLIPDLISKFNASLSSIFLEILVRPVIECQRWLCELSILSISQVFLAKHGYLDSVYLILRLILQQLG